MKTKSKALLLALCAVLLVVASVLTTLAFLTDTDSVDNVFTVGNVKIGDNLQKGIDEALVNENGQPLKQSEEKDPTTGEYTYTVVEKDQATRVQENEYKLQPGKTYVKDPTIHVASSSDPCFLFVKVENGLVQTIDGDTVAIEAASVEGGYQNIEDQMAALGWAKVEDDKIVDGIYAYIGTDEGATLPVQVAGGSNPVVFNEFKVGSDVNGTTLDQFANKKIVVTAYAVQASGFEGQDAVQIITAAFPALVKTAD